MDGVRGAEEHSLMLSERYLIIAHRKTRDRLRPGITGPLLCTSIIVEAAMRGITKERTPQSTLVNQQGSQCQYYRRSGFRHETLHDCTRQSRAHIHSQVNVEECKPKSKKPMRIQRPETSGQGRLRRYTPGGNRPYLGAASYSCRSYRLRIDKLGSASSSGSTWADCTNLQWVHNVEVSCI